MRFCPHGSGYPTFLSSATHHLNLIHRGSLDAAEYSVEEEPRDVGGTSYMPALINFAASMVFGASMALVARRSSAMVWDLVSWPLLLVIGFQCLVMTPVATYLFQFYPQWSLFYWFDPQLFPRFGDWVTWLSFGAVMLNWMASTLSYISTRKGIVEKNTFFRLLPFGIAASIFLPSVAIYWEQIAFLGDYDSYLGGQGVPIFVSFAGWCGITIYLVGFLFLLWAHSRFGRRDPALF